MSDAIYILVRYEERISGHGESYPEIAEFHPFYFFQKEKADKLKITLPGIWSVIKLHESHE